MVKMAMKFIVTFAETQAFLLSGINVDASRRQKVVVNEARGLYDIHFPLF